MLKTYFSRRKKTHWRFSLMTEKTLLRHMLLKLQKSVFKEKIQKGPEKKNI